MQKFIITILFAVSIFIVQQNDVKAQSLDSLGTVVEKLNDDFIVSKRLKFSGYVQAQWQHADTVGISSFAGGNFPSNVDNRFSIRRGRLKATYDIGISQMVLQLDVTEKGVGIKDAYLKISDPFIQVFSFQAGVFDRPFGFEISYSSSIRESPERSRMFQTIFPGERDLGAKLVLQAPKTSKLNIFKLEGGLFNGTGPTAVDFDSHKDFIGNFSFNKSLKNEKANFAARVSYYNGGYRQPTKFIYNRIGDIGGGISGFLVDSTSENKGSIVKREYFGADAQISVLSMLGLSTLRAEYIYGTQAGTASTTTSPSSEPTSDAFIRNFNGAYFYFLQNIGQSKHQLLLKYDWYDPNTDVSGDQLGQNKSKLTKTDLKYTTIGLGWVYRFDANLKFIVYYDMVENEISSNLNGFDKDLKDNVLTLRIQYKF